MQKELEVRIPPSSVDDEAYLLRIVGKKLRISENRIRHIEALRRSIDARKRNNIQYVFKLKAWIDESFKEPIYKKPNLQAVHDKEEVHIVGMGPAGLFAAIALIEEGFKPIIIERGKPVRDRRRDLAVLMREGKLNEESNYCFGEGGAGTFSDGKLYTRSKKRGSIRQILEYLVFFGASPNILIDAHPHIGTNKLPAIIQNISTAITQAGGEIWFNHRLNDIQISPGGGISELHINQNEKIRSKALILATGHSAGDVYRLLHQRKILIESKPFAVGVRIEHPQHLIDQIQYRCSTQRPIGLPAASYSWVQQSHGLGVFSFCMCPGGIICPASTRNGQLVVNGWSPSKRNSAFANSGIVVEAKAGSSYSQNGPLTGLSWQESIEKKAFSAGGGAMKAPAQRLTDFMNNRISKDLPACSYHPGISSVDLREVLPEEIILSLKGGFKAISQKMKGYLHHEAVLVGVESRTSSPIRIPRDPNTLMHPHTRGLFPCGEGAGYAGGIMSAAIDGQRVAAATAAYLVNAH